MYKDGKSKRYTLFLTPAILVYRVFRNQKKRSVKILHAMLHAFALIFSSVGLKAVFDSHNLPEKKIPNMYSLHSWIGISTIALFGMQVSYHGDNSVTMVM
jgi:cytochrome b-561